MPPGVDHAKEQLPILFKNGVALAKVNVDVAKDATAHFKIKSMPTFKLLDNNGNVITEVSGGSEANVDKLVQLAKSYA